MKANSLRPLPRPQRATCNAAQLKKTGFVEQQADDDQRNKGAGGIPDDLPHQRDISEMHHPKDQRQHRTQRRTPADAEAFGLPDH